MFKKMFSPKKAQKIVVKDSPLPEVEFSESPLEKFLLMIFRNVVRSEMGGDIKSSKGDISGLLEEGRAFMLDKERGNDPVKGKENQVAMVRRTLQRLLTPIMPPFYKIFMSAEVPDFPENKYLDREEWAGRSLNPVASGQPWFYAPTLTSWIVPLFFGFLVGPSKANFRKDGRLGGVLVEKCKVRGVRSQRERN